MSEPFLAEIKIVGFNFAPRGWAFCDGQILPINQNQSLYSLMGTTYGGDGRTSFGLPDLRGRTPIHVSDDHRLGQKTGVAQVTLSEAEMPAHNHTVKATNNVSTASIPGNSLVFGAAGSNVYHTVTNTRGLNPAAYPSTGGGQAHTNLMPFQTLNYVIALRGLFPSRN